MTIGLGVLVLLVAFGLYQWRGAGYLVMFLVFASGALLSDSAAGNLAKNITGSAAHAVQNAAAGMGAK